jgi:hypothetical protein
MARNQGPSAFKMKLRPKAYKGAVNCKSRILVQNGKILTPEGEDLLVEKARAIRHPKKMAHIFNGAIEHGPDAGCDLCDKARRLNIAPQQVQERRNKDHVPN